MNMLRPSDMSQRPLLSPLAPASVSLGEGRGVVVPSSGVVSVGTVAYLSVLVHQLYSGIDYMSRNVTSAVPDDFSFLERPTIPVTLKITAVGRPDFYFDDQD
jgi:hypothetical protein